MPFLSLQMSAGQVWRLFLQVLDDASSAQCWLYRIRQAGAVHSHDSRGGLHLISEESL